MKTDTPEKNFTSETTDNCDDDARTEQNRAGSPNNDNGPEENVEQRSQDDMPTRDTTNEAVTKK